MIETKKMGRPPKEDAATIRRDFRLTKSLDQRLKQYCTNAGMQMGTVVRMAVEAFLDVHEGK